MHIIGPRLLLLLSLLLLSVVTFCQSSQQTTPAVQTPEEYLQSLVGQKLLLLHFGDSDYAKIKKSDLHKVKISCDSAVQIQSVHQKNREVTLDWRQIGTPTPGKNFPRNCRDNTVHDRGKLIITQLAPDETASSLAESVSNVLQTPEQYLATEGVPFHLPPEPDEQQPVVGAQIPPRALLIIDATFSEEARQSRYSGNVAVRFTVGTDGRVHQPKIFRPLGMGLNEQVLAVLPLLRFQPANKDGNPVAAIISIEMSFNLY